MPDRPYIIQCKNCNKWYGSSKQNQRKCGRCRSKRVKYPRMYFYRKHFAYARDKFICQRCKKDFRETSGMSPAVHHIDANKKNNSLENLVTLCNSCHGKIHGTYKSKRELKAYGKKAFPLQNYTIKEPEPIIKRKPQLFTGI